ncbi:undecaprenyl-phosphate galactosephosphotransferase, partial [sediment metagenome]
LLALANFAVNFFVQVSFTRTVTLLAWLLVALLLPIGRIAAREWMIPVGLWRRKALVVGEGENAREAIAALQRERHMGIEVAGTTTFMSGRIVAPATDTDEYGSIPADLMTQGVESLARQLDCDVIVVALDEEARGRAAQLVRTLHAQQFEVFVVPSLEGLPVHGMQPQHFFSNDVLILRLQHKLLSPVSRGLKRSLDVVLAGSALLVFSPLMAWVAWRIWHEDGRPVVFSHARVGHDGQEFPFYKFRSMVRDADRILESWQTDNPALFERYVTSNFKLRTTRACSRLGG